MKRTTVSVQVEVDPYDILEDISSEDLKEILVVRGDHEDGTYNMSTEFLKRVLWSMEKSEDFTIIEMMDTRNLFGL